MLTALVYVLVIAAVGAVLFLASGVVFGRGEELAPLPPGTTVTALPEIEVTSADIAALRFPQSLRGYRTGEVDWALERLGGELDRQGRVLDRLIDDLARYKAEHDRLVAENEELRAKLGEAGHAR